jgi:hypothetical protein
MMRSSALNYLDFVIVQASEAVQASKAVLTETRQSCSVDERSCLVS